MLKSRYDDFTRVRSLCNTTLVLLRVYSAESLLFVHNSARTGIVPFLDDALLPDSVIFAMHQCERFLNNLVVDMNKQTLMHTG